MARTYRSATRTEAARTTRRRILAVAYTLLVADGYEALNMAGLARAAGVSPQTIYNAVGSKAQVLKACYDVTLAGDDEPVAMNDRPGIRAALEATSPEAYMAAYSAWCRVVYDRVGALLGAVLRGGGAVDAGAAEFAATIDRERRSGTTNAFRAYQAHFGLPHGLTLERVVDSVWTLNSPEVYDRLVRRCGWTTQAYEAWLAEQLRATLAIDPVCDA